MSQGDLFRSWKSIDHRQQKVIMDKFSHLLVRFEIGWREVSSYARRVTE